MGGKTQSPPIGSRRASTAVIVFYCAHVQAANLVPIGALVHAFGVRGVNALTLRVSRRSQLRDPAFELICGERWFLAACFNEVPESRAGLDNYRFPILALDSEKHSRRFSASRDDRPVVLRRVDDLLRCASEGLAPRLSS